MSLPKEEMIEILQNEIETLKKRLERKEKELEEMKKPTLVWPVPPERFRNKTTDT